MSDIYPRTITVTRPGAQTSAVGDQGEAPSMDSTLETVVAKGLKASIQARSSSGRNPVGLPGDVPLNIWRIFVRKRDAKLGTIQNRDIITDDLGNRFMVRTDYWNEFGYRLECERLEP